MVRSENTLVKTFLPVCRLAVHTLVFAYTCISERLSAVDHPAVFSIRIPYWSRQPSAQKNIDILVSSLS